MGRPKQEITKSVYIRFRVEPKLRKQYMSFCKKNNFKPSNRLREFVLNDLNLGEKNTYADKKNI
jgi:hypothetical protein